MWNLKFQQLKITSIGQTFLDLLQWKQNGNWEYRPQFVKAAASVLKRYENERKSLPDKGLCSDLLHLAVLEEAWVTFVKRFRATSYESFGTLTMLRCLPAEGSWDRGEEMTANVPTWVCRSRLCPWCSWRRATLLLGKLRYAFKDRSLTHTAFFVDSRSREAPEELFALERPTAVLWRTFRRGMTGGVKRALLQPRWVNPTELSWNMGLSILAPSDQSELTSNVMELAGQADLTVRQSVYCYADLPRAVAMFCQPPMALYGVKKIREGSQFLLDPRLDSYFSAVRNRWVMTGFGTLRTLRPVTS